MAEKKRWQHKGIRNYQPLDIRYEISGSKPHRQAHDRIACKDDPGPDKK